MQKTNIRDRISQRKYYLARLGKQCLQVYADHRQRATVDQLASLLATMSFLPPQYSLARIEIQLASSSYQLTQYAQAKVRQLARQLDKAKYASSLDARQYTTPQQSFTRHLELGTYLSLGTQPPTWSPLDSQLASYLTQLGCFQVVKLGHSLAKQGGTW